MSLSLRTPSDDDLSLCLVGAGPRTLGVLALTGLLGVLAGCGGGPGATSGVAVVATSYPLAYVAGAVGGDLVEVTNLTPPGGDSHGLEPPPRDVVALERADVVVDGILGIGGRPGLSGAALAWVDEVPEDAWVVAVDLPSGADPTGETPLSDAVFADDDGGATVVDWKTGDPPGTPEAKQHAAVQLGVYRLAWAALQGCPVESVRASFHYVRSGLTVSPDDLPGPDDLLAMLGTTAA